MISVLPLKNREEIKALFEKNNRDFCELSGCVTATENNNILGYCIYYLDNEKMTILEIMPQNDLSLADGILRSAIHNAVCKKVSKVIYDQQSPVEIFKKLDFILNAQEKTLNVKKLFESCCSCADKNT